MPRIISVAPIPAHIADALHSSMRTCQLNTEERFTGNVLAFFEQPDDDLLAAQLQECQQMGCRTIALTLTEKNMPPSAYWRLLEAGADDVLVWESMVNPADVVAQRLERWEKIERILHSDLVRENLVGTSQVWLNILRQVIEAACFTDSPILITGESGTGKELVSRLVHTLDCREEKGELIIVDCAAIVPELSGSEFFGHEKGSFTHAIATRTGAFAQANGGTLFLDEVGELPLRLQAELLRAIQEKTYKRVGGNQWFKSNFRLICATNRVLENEVRDGRFRQDLYYRIAGWQCRLPSLSQRRDDIVPLASHFLAKGFPEQKRPPTLSLPVRDFLLQRAYPGNVRELKLLVTNLAARHCGHGAITIGDIPPNERPIPGTRRAPRFNDLLEEVVLAGMPLKEIGRQATDSAIEIALALEGGNLHRAAIRLGVSDRALQMRRANKI